MPEKLPTVFDDDILGYEFGTVAQAPEDDAPTRPPTHVYSLVYPPIGFFPFYGIGNGDYHGFYWPIGQEEGAPIVAFSSHDAASLIPEHSDIDALYRCQLARSTEDDDADSEVIYRELVTQATGEPAPEHDIRGVVHDDFTQLLALDPSSPFYLCAAADGHVANNELDLAEQSYRKSLDVLPEYVAAHFGLASLLRRLRRGEEASVHLRKTLIGPQSFYGGSFWSDTALPGTFRKDWVRKALIWLQRSNAVHDTLLDDPFTKSVGQLTFQSGLAENPDIDVLHRITEEYAVDGRFADAVSVWQLIGDRAAQETTTFRERYRLTPSTFGARLAELLELSGNILRATLVRNMLQAMEKPNGLYL